MTCPWLKSPSLKNTILIIENGYVSIWISVTSTPCQRRKPKAFRISSKSFERGTKKPFQVGQAEQAVSIYYEIVEQMRVRNGNNTGKQAGKHVALCPATGMTISEGTYPAVSGETKGISPPSRNIKGFDVSKKRAINTQVQKVCESPERKAPNNQSEQRARNGIDRIQTGMDWKPAFEGPDFRDQSEALFTKHQEKRSFTSAPLPIPFGLVSPPICYRPTTTSAPFKNY